MQSVSNYIPSCCYNTRHSTLSGYFCSNQSLITRHFGLPPHLCSYSRMYLQISLLSLSVRCCRLFFLPWLWGRGLGLTLLLRMESKFSHRQICQVLNTTTFYKHTHTKSHSPTSISYYKIYDYLTYKLVRTRAGMLVEWLCLCAVLKEPQKALILSNESERQTGR